MGRFSCHDRLLLGIHIESRAILFTMHKMFSIVVPTNEKLVADKLNISIKLHLRQER